MGYKLPGGQVNSYLYVLGLLSINLLEKK